MGEKAIDPVRGNRQLRVVVIIRMDPDTIGERRKTRRHLAVATNDRRWTRCPD